MIVTSRQKTNCHRPMTNCLVVLPVYNEVRHVRSVLEEVARYAPHILVVNDGSTDGTAELLAEMEFVQVITHARNLGYGAALMTAFSAAVEQGYAAVITIDCDGQHQPQLIPALYERLQLTSESPVDIVSGSRYLQEFSGDTLAPEDRRKINFTITAQLNRQLGLNLTDSFCGFKAYRTQALERLHITEPGYAMPLQLWVQAACAQLNIIEYAVPRVYLEEERSFGGSLDNSKLRLAHYQEVIARELARISADCQHLITLQSQGA
jgi:glycosyltransferase involved in cell wall biosynthesis